MQALITIPVIDTFRVMAQAAEMLSHEEILTELRRQIALKMIKQVDVATALGIPPARVSEMRKGDRRIQPNEMSQLVNLLGMTSEYAIRDASLLGVTDIPILGKVAAGAWLEQSFIEPEEAATVPYDRLAGDPDTSSLFAVVTEGDSMNLAFPANAILICRHISNGFLSIRSGDYVIVERESHDLREMTCKRIEIDDAGDYLLVSESSNPKHCEPLRVPRSLDNDHNDVGINIVGKLVRLVLDYERH